MQYMGELSQRQLKEGMQIFTQMAAKANISKARSRRISSISAKSFKIAAAVPQAEYEKKVGLRKLHEVEKADFWSNATNRKIPKLSIAQSQ